VALGQNSEKIDLSEPASNSIHDGLRMSSRCGICFDGDTDQAQSEFIAVSAKFLNRKPERISDKLSMWTLTKSLISCSLSIV